MIGNQTISNISDNLEANLSKELRDQGHYLTGALERSIRSRQSSQSTGEVAETEALDYIDDLNEGIPASHIDISDPVYIAGLTRYAELRFGKRGGAALKAAVAIARKHSEEGMPTRNSYQYSSTGERLFAIQDSYNKNEEQIDTLLETGLSRELDQYIDDTFTETIF